MRIRTGRFDERSILATMRYSPSCGDTRCSQLVATADGRKCSDGPSWRGVEYQMPFADLLAVSQPDGAAQDRREFSYVARPRFLAEPRQRSLVYAPPPHAM